MNTQLPKYCIGEQQLPRRACAKAQSRRAFAARMHILWNIIRLISTIRPLAPLDGYHTFRMILRVCYKYQMHLKLHLFPYPSIYTCVLGAQVLKRTV